MTKPSKLLQEGRKAEIWERYCGYTKLSLTEFMGIQNRLLMEQLNLLSTSKIGKSILGKDTPTSIDDFRRNTPLTTYEDYEDMLVERNPDILPVEPMAWMRTSGRTSGRGPKWVPITKPFYDRLADAVVGSMIMSSCSHPGDVKLQLNDKCLLATAPPPYFTAYITRSADDQLDLKFLPPLDEGEQMDFGVRIATGFRLAMREGLDYFYGLSSVLARMGAQFEETSDSGPKISVEHLNPFVLWRLIRAVIKARLNNNKLLPKDIWKLKGIMTGGTDTEIYRDKIEYYWGIKPLEGYACTEGGTMGMQSWNFKGMTFFPDSCFLEFIPLDDLLEQEKNPAHPLSTVLVNELEIGIYELVLTNFHGGIFVRYRVGDMFEVIGLEDQEIDCKLPQVRFYSRTKDIIDIGGFTRLSEKEIWQAIEESKIPYHDWVARKEIENSEPVLHIYIELQPGKSVQVSEARELIDKHLTCLVSEYEDLKTMLNYDALKVSLLPTGSFGAYMNAQVKAGADLAHIKPPHMQPPDAIMESLLSVKEI
ncbi:GH3 auxin-responsive promoter family protein [Chloroflexota bacterium]